METDSLLEDLQTKRTSWNRGFQFWRAVYYGGNSIAVVLPLILAADFLPEGTIKRVLLLITSVIIAIMAFLQPSSKATNHEHAYLCLEYLIMKYRAKVISSDQATTQAAYA